MGREKVRGKVVVVTGASSGIGREIALTFARAGAHVVLSARNVPALEQLAEGLRKEGCEALVVPAEVTSEADMRRLVERTQAAFQRVDIVVSCAGVYIRSAVSALTLEAIRRCVDVNFYGTVHLIRAALPVMLAQRSGHVIAISSVDGKKGLPPDAAYAASKFAVTGFMDVLRQELRGTGVFATTIFPERVDTPMIRTLQLSPFSRRVPPIQVARAALRAVRQHRREMFVSPLGPKALVVLSTLWPALGDWIVRVTRLEGVEMPESAPDA